MQCFSPEECWLWVSANDCHNKDVKDRETVPCLQWHKFLTCPYIYCRNYAIEARKPMLISLGEKKQIAP